MRITSKHIILLMTRKSKRTKKTGRFCVFHTLVNKALIESGMYVNCNIHLYEACQGFDR